MRFRSQSILLFSLLPAALSTLASCNFNIFDPIDSATSQEQILEEARVCLDNRDYACARAAYAKLSTSYSEISTSEQAFLGLDEVGAGMDSFIVSIPKGDAGTGLTTMAGRLAVLGAGVTRRVTIFNILKTVSSIPNNNELRGLVRFVAAYALAAELLAEQAAIGGDTNVLNKTDLVTDSSCVSSCSGSGAGVLCATCNFATGVMTYNAGDDPSSADAFLSYDLSGSTPKLGWLNGALKNVNYGLANELAASGRFQLGSADFASLLSLAFVISANTYAGYMVSLGVGL